MAKTICIPEDLEKSLVDTLFDHLNYQIYEVDHACEYGTETVSMLDFLDLLGYDTFDWRDDYEEIIAKDEYTKEYEAEIAPVVHAVDLSTNERE